MKRAKTIARYEMKMMFRRTGYWGILLFALVVSLMDNFPSYSNLNRLSFLTEPGYLVSRLLVQTGLLILFGIVFLTSNAIGKDIKGDMGQLIMSTDTSKCQYIIGKFIGHFIPTMILFAIYFFVHALIQFLLLPQAFSLKSYFAGYFVLAFTATFFVVGISIALPMWFDIRFFYAVISFYFLANLLIVPESIALPFWFLFYGDLIKIVYQYGFGIIQFKNLFLNFAFLFGTGIISILSLEINYKFWRENAGKQVRNQNYR